MFNSNMTDQCVSTDKIRISGPDAQGIAEVTEKKLSKYIIMHENTEVLTLDANNGGRQIINEMFLPYGLRFEGLTGFQVYTWIKQRISNLSRTFMNKVYIARDVGRDDVKVIQDSCAISAIDNFWIKTDNTLGVTWDELKSKRDINRQLSDIALSGILKPGGKEGRTSLFTLKGYFPKCVQGGYIYKLRKDAELEYPAFLIGEQLGVDIAECEIEGTYVKIKLFTNDNVSLVHANELQAYFDVGVLYNAFLRDNRRDILGQLERMYIFNYVIGNADLHDENYGVLYDPKTFELLRLAPLFDHNVAFDPEFKGVARNSAGGSLVELDALAKRFIVKHTDIAEKLKGLDFSIISRYLRKEQIRQLKDRVKELIG